MEVLESLRTRPGMMLKKKKSSGGPPVLTPGELKQMLEDTHVTKVWVEYKIKRSFRFVELFVLSLNQFEHGGTNVPHILEMPV